MSEIPEPAAVPATIDLPVRMVNVYALLGLTEIRTMFDLDPQTPHQWRSRGVLPDPLPRLVSSRPVWEYDAIVEFAVRTGRKIVNPYPWPDRPAVDQQQEGGEPAPAA